MLQQLKYRVRVNAEFELTAFSESQALHEATLQVTSDHCTIANVENPNQEKLFRDCKAQRVNDQMICGPCGLTWDIDDPEPPVCRKGK